MPRTRFDNIAKRAQEPPIDWLKAAILERIDQRNITKAELAQQAGIGYANFLVLMRKSPMDWRREQRESVCRVLGIETVLTVVGQPKV